MGTEEASAKVIRAVWSFLYVNDGDIASRAPSGFYKCEGDHCGDVCGIGDHGVTGKYGEHAPPSCIRLHGRRNAWQRAGIIPRPTRLSTSEVS